jgi:hypothetical protein
VRTVFKLERPTTIGTYSKRTRGAGGVHLLDT